MSFRRGPRGGRPRMPPPLLRKRVRRQMGRLALGDLSGLPTHPALAWPGKLEEALSVTTSRRYERSRHRRPHEVER
jgi:hypothetical protein